MTRSSARGLVDGAVRAAGLLAAAALVGCSDSYRFDGNDQGGHRDAALSIEEGRFDGNLDGECDSDCRADGERSSGS